MKVIIYGENEDTTTLQEKVKRVLEDIGLTDFIQVEYSQSTELKSELSISAEPALIIEEESIDFKDMIFEGMVPEEEELKSMFVSIIGWSSGGGCGSKTDEGGCGTWCSC